MSQDRGAIDAGAARCGWALDGGALHLHSFAGDTLDAGALVAAAVGVATECNAAVCVATLDEADPWVAALVAHGFAIDDEEPTVRGGKVRNELTLLRVV